MTRRKFSREFMIEAVRLVTQRAVSVAQAARDLDLAESVLQGWMRELTAAPAAASPGNGQMRADVTEIAALNWHSRKVLIWRLWRSLKPELSKAASWSKIPDHLSGTMPISGIHGVDDMNLVISELIQA